MAELKYKPVRHSHETFLAKAATRRGFVRTYDSLAAEYERVRLMLERKRQARLG